MLVSWLLLRHTGKSNLGRLILTAGAIAIGTLLLLTFVAGVNALSSRSEHSNWRLNFFGNPDASIPIEGVDPLKVSFAFDGNLNSYKNQQIYVTSLFATGPTSPQLQGLPTPKSGEYYVSPALNRIIENHPTLDIGSRFGNTLIGEMPERFVVSPDSLEVVRGMSPNELQSPLVSPVYKLDEFGGGSPFSGLILVILIVGAVVLFFPIVAFLSVTAQLGIAQREKRYSALRLIGATRSQLIKIVTLEVFVVSIIGIVVGAILFGALRPHMLGFRLDGLRMWPWEFVIEPLQFLAISCGVILLSVLASLRGTRRAQSLAFAEGAKKSVIKSPSAVRLLPLALGTGVYVWVVMALKPGSTGNFSQELLMILLVGGVILVMIGLLVGGPYLTHIIAKLLGARTRNPSTLIASKRIGVRYTSVFRAVSGVVLALFAGSFYLTAVSGIEEYSQRAISSNGYSQLLPKVALVFGADLPTDLDANLGRLEYVKSEDTVELGDDGAYIRCSVLSTYTKLSCNGTETYAVVNFSEPIVNAPKMSDRIPERYDRGYLVLLNSNSYLDQLRTFVADIAIEIRSSTGGVYVVSGTYSQQARVNPLISELAELAYVGIAITLLLAIASLSVSTIGGLLERKRSFATLRLGGMTVPQMKYSVRIEAVLPLLVSSLVASAIGCWIGYVFIRQMGSSLQAYIEPSYLLIVGGILILTMIVIESLLPVLEKMTRPEANQTE